MRHTRCRTWCGTMRGTCQIAGEASKVHRCSTGTTTSALACADTVATSAARASGRIAVRYGGKACEDGKGCESRRAGPDRAARPTLARRASGGVQSCLLRALWQERSLCVPQGCSRATAAAGQLASAPAMTCLRPLAGWRRSQVDFMPEHICQVQAFCDTRQVALKKQKVHIGLIRACCLKRQE